MKIVLLIPFYTGSHKNWADELKKNSSFDITLLSLKGIYWKWRMHGAAITFAEKIKKLDFLPDLIVTTDMLDLSLLKSVLPNSYKEIPVIVYFHENQLTYPWSPTDKDVKLKRDIHYGFINYTSALVADKVLFNSSYHKQSFLMAIEKMLKKFPDNKNLETIAKIEKKSFVQYLGLDLKKFNNYENSKKNNEPLIIWNHRWEYDKNPKDFFETLFKLQKNGKKFKLAILGENFKKSPKIFEIAKKELKDKILHFGYCDKFEDYAKWLTKGDLLPVTSNQDFFGISAIEGIYCGCFPLLPKRLAFPEHLDSDKFYYSTKNELYEKISSFIDNYETYKKISFKKLVEKYSWENQISKIEEKFL